MTNHHTMFINRKTAIILALASVATVAALTSMAPQPEVEKPTNLKVLPKNLTERQVHQIMHEWAVSLGVRCDFCHVANADGKGLDFPNDSKPEKEMARHMFKMMNKINKKYFEAGKDSLGMVQHTGINCYTCHRGDSHPETKIPEMKRGPGGPPPGGAPGGPPPGGPGSPQKQ